MRKTAAIILAPLTLACLGVGPDDDPPPAKQAPRPAATETKGTPERPEDAKAIRDVGAAFARAYDKGDARAIADLFTDDAEVTNEAGATIRAYDPAGMANAAPLLPGIGMAASAAEALHGADLAVLMTEWAEFTAIDLADMARLLRRPVLVDLRNLYDPEAAASAGLAYHSIGRTAREVTARAAVEAGSRPQAAE